MSDSTESLRKRLGGARDLRNVVRTMKTLAASNIGQYERAVRALDDYHRSVELGLWTCLHEDELPARVPHTRARLRLSSVEGPEPRCTAVVFGSDQGLVGRFNEAIVEFLLAAVERRAIEPRCLAVGERVRAKLMDTDIPVVQLLRVPGSPVGITHLVGELLVETERIEEAGQLGELLLFYNQPGQGAPAVPTELRVLPLDAVWLRRLTAQSWPRKQRPETLGDRLLTLRGLLREYLFVVLYRAMAESLASENMSRLLAMQRAEKNIDERLEELTLDFNRLRQSEIDEELFDVIAGFEALGGADGSARKR